MEVERRSWPWRGGGRGAIASRSDLGRENNQHRGSSTLSPLPLSAPPPSFTSTTNNQTAPHFSTMEPTYHRKCQTKATLCELACPLPRSCLPSPCLSLLDLLICLPACLPTCLCFCIFTHLPACLPAYVCVFFIPSVYPSPHVSVHLYLLASSSLPPHFLKVILHACKNPLKALSYIYGNATVHPYAAAAATTTPITHLQRLPFKRDDNASPHQRPRPPRS